MSATNRGCERKAYDFYATPPETVRAFLANFDGISAGDRILEPSAGRGTDATSYSWFVWERGGDRLHRSSDHQNHLRRTSAWKTLT